MKRKFVTAFAWVLIAALAIVVVTDGVVALGARRCWQFIFNLSYLFVALPALLAVALRSKTNA